MNLISSFGNAGSWQRLRTQYVALAAGLAIAASAALALGGWEGSAAQPASQARASAPSGWSVAPGTSAEPRLIVYIAGSEQQADDYRDKLTYAAQLTQPVDPDAIVNFVVITEPEEAKQASDIYAEAAHQLMAHGVSFEMVDLRGR